MECEGDSAQVLTEGGLKQASAPQVRAARARHETPATRGASALKSAVALDNRCRRDLRSDVPHRQAVTGGQPGSRSEQGAHISEGIECRAVGNGDHPVGCKQGREFLVGDPLGSEALEQRRGHEHDSYPGGRQAPVNLAEERLAEADLVLAEPDRRAKGGQQVAQLLRGTVPVVPGVA